MGDLTDRQPIDCASHPQKVTGTFLPHCLDAQDLAEVRLLFSELERFEPARIYRGGPDHQVDTQIRRGLTRGLWPAEFAERPWLQKIRRAAVQANEFFFKQPIREEISQINLNYYRAPGDFFEWHQDNGADIPYSRRLTAVMLVQTSSDLRGGDLQIKNPTEQQIQLSPGDLAVFPSSVVHRVLPVTQGYRCSMTLWFEENN